MNILHEFLILLENEEKIPIYRFNRWGKAKAKGALGKLLALRYIQKNPDKTFQISSKGLDFINKTLETIRQKRLDFLHDELMFLSLKFPETERGKRDKLRSFLKMSSFLKLGGMWIIPSYDEEQTIKFLKESGVLGEILLIRGHVQNKEILEKLKTQIEKTEKNYSSWILQTKTKMKGLEKRTDRNYVIKRLIFDYSLIKKEDILPSNIIPDGWIDQDAQKLYVDLKKLLD